GTAGGSVTGARGRPGRRVVRRLGAARSDSCRTRIPGAVRGADPCRSCGGDGSGGHDHGADTGQLDHRAGAGGPGASGAGDAAGSVLGSARGGGALGADELATAVFSGRATALGGADGGAATEGLTARLG